MKKLSAICLSVLLLSGSVMANDKRVKRHRKGNHGHHGHHGHGHGYGGHQDEQDCGNTFFTEQKQTLNLGEMVVAKYHNGVNKVRCNKVVTPSDGISTCTIKSALVNEAGKRVQRFDIWRNKRFGVQPSRLARTKSLKEALVAMKSLEDIDCYPLQKRKEVKLSPLSGYSSQEHMGQSYRCAKYYAYKTSQYKSVFIKPDGKLHSIKSGNHKFPVRVYCGLAPRVCKMQSFQSFHVLYDGTTYGKRFTRDIYNTDIFVSKSKMDVVKAYRTLKEEGLCQ